MQNLRGAAEKERMHDVALHSALREFLVENYQHWHSESGETDSHAGLTTYQQHQLYTETEKNIHSL